jgi:CRP-like cAMP-binding protein
VLKTSEGGQGSFSGINPDLLQRLSGAGHHHHYQAGAFILREGDRCSGLHILTEGMARIYRLGPEGRLHTLALLKPTATFNEVSAVDGGANPYNAVAVTQARVVVISHAALLDLLTQDGALMASYVQALAHVNREYIERLEDMTFRTIPSRLAKLFLMETSYAGQYAEQPTQMTQEEIAAILGTTREVVGRALRGLLNAGLLRKERRRLFIADRAGLEYLAETNLMPDTAAEPDCPKPMRRERV